MKRILITGVAGFIGSHIANRFSHENWEVFGVDDLSSGRKENIPKGINYIHGDLSDKEAIQELPANCDLILHLAGQSSGEISFDDPIADLNKNTTSTLNLIRYGIKKKVSRFLYASSMSVYGDVPDEPISEDYGCSPLSCYGVGKLAAENYLRIYQHQLPYVALRMFNVYGPGQDMKNLRQGMVSIYLAQAMTTGQIEVKGSLNRFRDLIFIDDVVEIWWRIANNQNIQNQVLNVGTGIKTTVKELLDRIHELVPNSFHFTNNATPGDQLGIYASTTKLETYIPFEKTSVEEGLSKFVYWIAECEKY